MRIRLATLATIGLMAFGTSAANAATSIAKARSLCKAAAEETVPAPESVRVRKNKIRSGELTISMPVRITAADGETKVVNCTVDRETQVATLIEAE